MASSLCRQGNQTTRGMMHTVLARRDSFPIVVPIHRGKTLKEGTRPADADIDWTTARNMTEDQLE